MHVAHSVDESARTVAGNLRDHHQEQAVARDVERNAQKDVRAALVELEIHFTVLVDVDLPKAMARRERHLRDLAGIPRGNNVATAKRVSFDPSYQVYNLIMRGVNIDPVIPKTPLDGVHRPEIPVFVAPLVPYRDAVLLQIFDV